jgi:hypothetical protein
MDETQPRRGPGLIAATLLAAIAIAACSGDGTGSPDISAPTVAATSEVAAAVSETTSPATATPTTVPATAASTTAPSDWPAAVSEMCSAALNAWMSDGPNDDPTVPLTEQVAWHRAARTNLPMVDPSALPTDVRDGPHGYAALHAAAESALADAERAAAAGDAAATETAMDEFMFQLGKTGRMFAVAGVPCAPGDPEGAASAELNVPVDLDTLAVTAGFDSLWVTEHDGSRVARLDPTNGAVLATIEIAGGPVKLQPADGRMWGRTHADAYFAIDPATNTITDTLPREAVGPSADRAWAVDGGLWICDGQRIHRFDPATLQPLAVVELGIPCDMPGGTSDLIVASTYNGDDGQSGTSAAAFIDPSTNELLATVPLPVDVMIGIVLDDSVFFAGEHGSQAVVVDRTTWTVRATPDLGRATGDLGTVEADAESIYVPTLDATDVLVVDTSTFAVTDTIPTLGTRSVTVLDGSLWTTGYDGYLQRFDP